MSQTVAAATNLSAIHRTRKTIVLLFLQKTDYTAYAHTYIFTL